MAFKSNPVAVGTGDTDVYEMGATLQGAVVLGIGNVNGSARTVTVKFYKQSLDATTVLTTGYSVAANTFVKFPIPLSMQTGDKIIMAASDADSIVASPTVTDSAAAPAAQGFTPRGAWDSGTTYAINDLVRVEDAIASGQGATYVSLQAANTNQDPTTETAWWMVYVADGAQGPAGAGDVVGPASAVDGNLAVFDTTTGKLLKDGGAPADAALTAAPAADTTASGPRVTLTAGENLAFGDAVYVKSDGKMWKTDADAEATMPVAFMALGTILADAAGSFLLPGGFVRNDAWAWTVGGAIYASGTAGGLTQTAPSAADSVTQVVGRATHADRMFFNPSPDYVTDTGA